MSRIRMALALSGVLSLSVAGAAIASPQAHINGGTATVTVTPTAAGVLASNNITAKALAPATQSGATFTYPIARGRLNTKTLHGVVVTKGGIQLSNGTKTVTIRELTVDSTKKGMSISALVRGRSFERCRLVGRNHRHARCAVFVRWNLDRIATLTGVTVSGSSATGTVDITARTAAMINRLAGKNIVAAGDPLGTATISPTFS